MAVEKVCIASNDGCMAAWLRRGFDDCIDDRWLHCGGPSTISMDEIYRPWMPCGSGGIFAHEMYDTLP